MVAFADGGAGMERARHAQRVARLAEHLHLAGAVVSIALGLTRVDRHAHPDGGETHQFNQYRSRGNRLAFLNMDALDDGSVRRIDDDAAGRRPTAVWRGPRARARP